MKLLVQGHLKRLTLCQLNMSPTELVVSLNASCTLLNCAENKQTAAGLQQNKLSKQRRKKKPGAGSAPLPHRSDEEPALCYTLYIQHSSSADEARVTR